MAQCFWCRNQERWTGKDSEGVRVYTCDEHKNKIKSDLYRLEKPRRPILMVGDDASDTALTGDLY